MSLIAKTLFFGFKMVGNDLFCIRDFFFSILTEFVFIISELSTKLVNFFIKLAKERRYECLKICLELFIAYYKC